MWKPLVASTLLCLGLYPQATACGTAASPDSTVRADLASPQVDLAETLRIQIPCGDGPGEIGFSPGGEEREPSGPAAFEVDEEGVIRVADTVNWRIVEIRADDPARPSISPAEGAAPDDADDREERATGEAAVRVEKTSAETGEVVFATPGGERRVEIDARGPLASARLLGVDPGGDAFVLVERFVALGSLEVERDVMVVSRSGRLVARAAVEGRPDARPRREFFLAPDGSLYRMIPRAEAVEFVRWEVSR